MKEEKEFENEVEEMKKVEELENQTQETAVALVEDFSSPIAQGNTRKKIQTTVKDMKVLFNLEDHIDFKLNDMEGKEINVVDVVVKSYEKDVPERLNEYTGELETVERSIVTILIDDTGTSYVTASKMFAMRIIQIVQMYKGVLPAEGLKIRITKTEHKSGNKKLGFELV